MSMYSLREKQQLSPIGQLRMNSEEVDVDDDVDDEWRLAVATADSKNYKTQMDWEHISMCYNGCGISVPFT